MSQWVAYSPFRLKPQERVAAAGPVRTALRWAAFAWLLRKDSSFATRMGEQVLVAAQTDYAALQRAVLDALDERVPWLAPVLDDIEDAPVEPAFEAPAQKLDLVAGEVLESGRQCFCEPAFSSGLDQLDETARRWLMQACTSWSEALLSLEAKEMNRTFPDYAPFAVALKQQLKKPDFTALYVEPEAVDEELWIAFARVPTVRRHLERQFGRGRQLRTVWALPKRREIANWLVLSD